MTYLGEESDVPPKKEGKIFDHGTKTRAAFFGQLRSDMRKRWMYSKVRAAVLKEASVSRNTSRCSECQREVLKTVLKYDKDGNPVLYTKGKQKGRQKRTSNLDVDHVVDCGSLRCFEDMSGFAERLFCGAEGLRVLCKDCHHKKTHKKGS